MRLLAVTNILPTSRDPSSGTFVEQQIKGLRRMGIEVHVLFADRAQGGISEYLKLGKRVRVACEDFSPDIVHSMYGGVMADVVVRSVRGTPTVVSFCGSDLLGELLSGTVRKIIAGYGIFASHRAARRTNGIIVKSKNLQDALPKDVNRRTVRIIPNGIDLDRFKPLDREASRKQLGWNSSTFHVLFPTNSGDPRKRINLALESIEAIKELGVRVELHQLKGVAHQDVPIWLNASDAILLTSLHEGSPNVIKEALGCNVPIVSVDVGDVQERIMGVEGCYLADANPSDIGAKLLAVSNGRHRVNGREHVEHLSLNNVAMRLKGFYEEVCMASKG